LSKETTENAIRVADIILVPVFPDLFSMLNLEVLYDLGSDLAKNNYVMPIVTVGFNNTSVLVARTLNNTFEKRHYPVAADVPFNKLIPSNIMKGLPWDRGIKMEHRWAYVNLFDDVVAASKTVHNGQKPIWNRRG
jgi:hypothetical protein